MALPNTREETATPASPVSSDLANIMQDAIIEIAGEEVYNFSPFAGFNDTNWQTGNAPSNPGDFLSSGGAAVRTIPLTGLRVGKILQRITIEVRGNASADLTGSIGVRANGEVTGGELATIDVQNPAAVFADQVFDFQADTGLAAMAIDSNPAIGLTRAIGSFLADGFFAGQSVALTGFANAGNNSDRVINSVTALSMLFTDSTGIVNEAAGVDERVQGNTHTIADGDHLFVYLVASAAALDIGTIRAFLAHPEV